MHAFAAAAPTVCTKLGTQRVPDDIDDGGSDPSVADVHDGNGGGESDLSAACAAVCCAFACATPIAVRRRTTPSKVTGKPPKNSILSCFKGCSHWVAGTKPEMKVSWPAKVESLTEINSDHWNFTAQVIPRNFFGDAVFVAVDPYTPERKQETIRNYANARRKAIDLAEGRGVIDDEDDQTPWEGVPHIDKNEVRKRPLIWESGTVLRFADDSDGYASYGRDPTRWIAPTFTHTVPERVERVLSKLGLGFEDFELLGDHRPEDSKLLNKCHVAPGVLPSTNGKQACATVKRTDVGAVVKLWLQDTGCGHDLIGMQEVKHLAH